jgi:hypothetical protein
LFAAFCSAITKPFGFKGIFYVSNTVEIVLYCGGIFDKKKSSVIEYVPGKDANVTAQK